MILLYGRPDDAPLRLVRTAALTLGTGYRVVDQTQLRYHELRVRQDTSGVDGCLVLGGEQIGLDQVTGVFARPLALPREPLYPHRALAFHEAFLDWLDYADVTVANRPDRMQSNTSKPYQAQLISAAGFVVPQTLVTDDPDEVRAFRAEHGRVVFKSVSGVRSVVTELDDEQVLRLARVRVLPTQFQAHVPGVDVRVHVVGEQVYATGVTSDATDYRYAGKGAVPVLAAVELPGSVAARCVALTAALGLHLCGIDLRRRPDGEYVCFEANPMPAFSYYEAGTGQPISRALVELLAATG